MSTFFCACNFTESFRTVIKLGRRVRSIILDFYNCYSASVSYLSLRLGVAFAWLPCYSFVSIDYSVFSFLMLTVLVLMLMLADSVNKDYLVKRTVDVRALIPSRSIMFCSNYLCLFDFFAFSLYLMMDS